MSASKILSITKAMGRRDAFILRLTFGQSFKFRPVQAPVRGR